MITFWKVRVKFSVLWRRYALYCTLQYSAYPRHSALNFTLTFQNLINFFMGPIYIYIFHKFHQSLLVRSYLICTPSSTHAEAWVGLSVVSVTVQTVRTLKRKRAIDTSVYIQCMAVSQGQTVAKCVAGVGIHVDTTASVFQFDVAL